MQVVWFKRDLRVFDHRPLAAAAARGPVLPLYVIEPEIYQQADSSGRHWAFIAECLQELRDELANLGQPLIVRQGQIIQALEAIQNAYGFDAIWSHEETGNNWTYKRDCRVADWCRANGVSWFQMRQHGVIRRLKNRDGWAHRWDRFMAEETSPPPHLAPIAGCEPGALPSVTDLGLKNDPCPKRQKGGRLEALATYESFLHKRGEPYRKAMSSPIEGAQGCSRLSPYLAYGSLSMREVAQKLWLRQRQLKEAPLGNWRASMRSFSGRLHWHCHFMQKLEDEPELEFDNLHKAYDGLRPKPGNTALLKAWQAGETGLPFVDACMRSLQATGWLNFRMRAMLMAVASYHLWLDWRSPGEHLARLFTDYEPGIHWPQVQMQSGTTGMNTVRIYNPVKQGKDQDPDGTFIRQWLPELKNVPDGFIHEPWLWDQASSTLDKTYPRPVIDHLKAAQFARDKVWRVRRGQTFRDQASSLQTKHGSRKSGIPNKGQRSKKADDRQLGLNL